MEEKKIYTVELIFKNDNDNCVKDFSDNEKAIGWTTVNLIEMIEILQGIKVTNHDKETLNMYYFMGCSEEDFEESLLYYVITSLFFQKTEDIKYCEDCGEPSEIDGDCQPCYCDLKDYRGY